MVTTALIVDDNASLAYFSAFALEQEIEGLKVFTATSCQEAMNLVHKRRPSVFIVDLKLPDGNGLRLVDELKHLMPHMVPILVTATVLPDHYHGDLFGVLTKPYDPAELIGIVRQALVSGDSWQERATEMHRAGEAGLPSGQHGFHHVQNRLSGLLAGIRALRLELHCVADDPSEVIKTIDEYADRLSAMVKEAAETIKRGVDRR